MRWRHSAYLCGDHEEAEEPVGEQHLHLLVVGGQVALRVVRLVRVGAAPLETLEHGNVISQHESFCITHYVIHNHYEADPDPQKQKVLKRLRILKPYSFM